ncbi:MAG: hypothetical protein QHH12_06330 [Candidatus Bathyarchaeota archaeon]|nr:hypothetical protein [Candidatus Bathyarchaeota archaeon A05DMB-3]MDH7607361.1 hypothetical protein [Candidatus Bathyarchaeota archaeon]
MVGINIKDQVGAKPIFSLHLRRRIFVISTREIDITWNETLQKKFYFLDTSETFMAHHLIFK